MKLPNFMIQDIIRHCSMQIPENGNNVDNIIALYYDAIFNISEFQIPTQ